MAMLELGTPAPAFSLPNSADEMTSLDDFSGRYVLLWWYPKADTPG